MTVTEHGKEDSAALKRGEHSESQKEVRSLPCVIPCVHAHIAYT